ncbi:MAG: DUF4260 domain-containing protein [Balneolaceae bacterium]|nr:DUF4260 domain-containing protein [Balneolaceae bacterium]
MEKLLKLEEAAQLIATIIFLVFIEADWWWYLILFIGPDIGMFGYVFSPKVGAYVYNLFHHKALAVIVFILGVYTQHDPILLLGAVLFGHAALDRIFGYGLKYIDDFKHTHLGRIGREFSED